MKLTIGMAVYDDYKGVALTIQSLRIYHHVPNIELLVVDNNPTSPDGRLTEDLVNKVNNHKWPARYIPYVERTGTAQPRNKVFEEGRGEIIMCVDSHVMLLPGALYYLLNFFERFPDSMDLVQGPILMDDLTNYSSHFEDSWGAGMWGQWGTDKRAEHPDNPHFEIKGQGLGLFACRKDAWLGFNSHFSGFGGEEMYIHEKYRQAGRKTWCIPGLRWWHCFGRTSTPYVATTEDKLTNYLIGFRELNLPTQPVYNHFVNELKIPKEKYDYLAAKVEQIPNVSEKKCGGCTGGVPLTPEQIKHFQEVMKKENPKLTDPLSQYVKRGENVLEFVDQPDNTHAFLMMQKPEKVWFVTESLVDAVVHRGEFKAGKVRVQAYKNLDQVNTEDTFDVIYIDKKVMVGQLENLSSRVDKRIIIQNYPAHMPTIITFLEQNMEWGVVYRNESIMVISKESETKHEMPSTYNKAKNYTKALIKRWWSGKGDAPEPIRKGRLALCLLCAHRNVEGCSLCGCPVKEKVTFLSESCPIEKWGAK